jgi:multidrug efflux pump subunit AcrA (membrane-fusion protein)
MATPLSNAAIPLDAGAWQELEEVFAGLGRLARSPATAEQFYRTLLEECVSSLSAQGGAIWLRTASGAFQPVIQISWPPPEFARSDNARRAHEEILAEAATSGKVALLRQPLVTASSDCPDLTDRVLLLGSVHCRDDAADSTPPTTLAIIELLLRPDASPASYRGSEQFLTAICELAADFHAFEELRRLRREDADREELIQLGIDSHRSLSLPETAYAVANEGRRVVGCDRLSVLAVHGNRCRLLATSGVGRVEHRSGAVRRMEEIADMVRRTDEAAYFPDGGSDAMPPIAAALEQHADESRARHIAVVPLRAPAEWNSEEPIGTGSSPSKKRAPRLILLAEQFDGRNGGLCHERLVAVGDVCVTALENALEMDQLPLSWVWRSIGAIKQQVTNHFPRTSLALAVAGAVLAALIWLPADFKIDAPGRLEPVVRRDVFAPRSGLVDAVLVAHGETVAAGQPLVKLRDPQLDLELKRVHGELKTAQRQIDAVRATRTNRAVRDANPTEAYRLSAEERELDQRLTNLRRELALLEQEHQKLTVASPIDGNVMTWDVDNRLVDRPVDRGEVLVTVADLANQWRLELEVPDDRIGFVLAAQEELQSDLPVRFRLSSDEREEHDGHITEICQTVKVVSDPGAAPTPRVLVKVALDDLLADRSKLGQLRPGMSAQASIECGRRSLGYVWLHDVWDTIVEWLQF